MIMMEFFERYEKMEIKGILFGIENINELNKDKFKLVLSGLKNSGKTLGIITEVGINSLGYSLSKCDIIKYFDFFSTAEDALPSKPHPARLWEFCDKYGFDSGEVLVVGNRAEDMEFAKKADANAVGVALNGENRIELEKNSDYIIENISELLQLV